MIITLIGADFSASNIGTLSSWRISRSLGTGATYEGVTSVDKGAAFSATVTLAEGYEIGTAGVTITMGGTVLSGAHSISGNVITITIASVTGNVLIKVPTVNTATGDEDEGGSNEPEVNYLFNLDFTKKSFADYIADGTLGSVTGTLSTTHTSNGDTFSSTDVSYVALGKSLTFPTNFEIQLKIKTSDYNHIKGCGIPLFTSNNARPWIFLRGDYDAPQGADNNYDNAFGLQSRLLTTNGDVITIDDVTIPCNDNIFHDVIIHYENKNVWMSVDGVKSKTVTTDRSANTVTHMFGYSATYTIDKVTMAYIRVKEL